MTCKVNETTDRGNGFGQNPEIARGTDRVLGTKPVGREAATRKYDILSALAALALVQEKHDQRRILRLMALITTRYNWQRNELTMGQAEIARLWGVDLRTVKREMAKLRAMGWLIETRGAARGRVASHALDLDLMMQETRGVWENIGPDFIERQTPRGTAAPAPNVVPFKPGNVLAPRADTAEGSLWGQACAVFEAQDSATYAAWIGRLAEVSREGAVLTLVAPSRFHASYVETHLADRLMRVLRQIDPSLREVRVEA